LNKEFKKIKMMIFLLSFFLTALWN